MGDRGDPPFKVIRCDWSLGSKKGGSYEASEGFIQMKQKPHPDYEAAFKLFEESRKAQEAKREAIFAKHELDSGMPQWLVKIYDYHDKRNSGHKDAEKALLKALEEQIKKDQAKKDATSLFEQEDLKNMKAGDEWEQRRVVERQTE